MQRNDAGIIKGRTIKAKTIGVTGAAILCVLLGMSAAGYAGQDHQDEKHDRAKAVAAKVTIPSEYQLQWGGQFEQLESASKRLMIVVLAALTLIFVLLYLNFKAATPALLIFLNIPLAA